MSFFKDDQPRVPQRPSLTIVFICSIVFWLGCACAYASGPTRTSGENELVAYGALVAMAPSACLLVSERARVVGCACLSLAVGVMLGASEACAVLDVDNVWEGAKGEPVTVVLLEDSRNAGFGEVALVEVRSERYGTAVFSGRFSSDGALLCGERLQAYGTFSTIDYGANRYAWQDGSSGTMKMAREEKVSAPFPLDAVLSARRQVIEGMGSQDEQHALLQALVCGYRRNLNDTDSYAEFQSCGLAHLVAVSGAHLVIVVGLFASVFKTVCLPRRVSIVALMAVMMAYYVLAGMPISALRAMVMSSLGLASYFGKRRPAALNSLGIGLFAIIALSPSSCISASLMLSALSTIGIVVFAPLISWWLGFTPLSRAPFVTDALSLTLSAALLSQPYATSLFNLLPLVSPLANVVCAPLFPIACTAGLLVGIVILIAKPAVSWLVDLAALVAGLLSGAAEILSSIPYASIPFYLETPVALAISVTASFVLWACWPRPGRELVMGALCVVLAIVSYAVLSSDATDRIVMLDVGQGDAILIESRGETLLIDTGNEDSKLLGELGKNHIAHLDSVLITHADDDHCGSLDALQKGVAVDRVLVAKGMLTCSDESAHALIGQCELTSSELVSLSYGDSFNVGAFRASVIWPHSFTENGGNADSLCLLLEYDGDGDETVDARALMTGDAESEELAAMLAEGDVGAIDILKVAHHGSRNGMTADEASVLRPKIALISCGAHNRYGHPAKQTLDLLSDIGAEVFRTDRDGEVKCIIEAGEISVSCIP